MNYPSIFATLLAFLCFIRCHQLDPSKHTRHHACQWFKDRVKSYAIHYVGFFVCVAFTVYSTS